uniref:retention module-containing protein n=1 Tax=Marinomonas lutimaris TaxID=2846746 RepID=UPI001CA4A467
MSDSQPPFATLGNAIGFITKLTGSVTIQSIDGQERVVKIGDPIFFGETVVTGKNSSVTIAFVDGTEVVIGGDSAVEMTDEIYNTGDNADLVADSSTDVDALQDAILAGDDPTLIQEAPAAGELTGEQQRVDVDIDRNDNTALPTFGNDTFNALPTFGNDTNNGNGGQTTQPQNPTPSTSDRTTPAAVSAPAVAGTVTVNPITADDVVNEAEASGTITVTGTATGGDISQGDPVVLVINGVTYTTVVSAIGTWSVGVAGADLAADTAFDAVVTSSNSSGNTVQSTGSSTHTVDVSADATITIDPITDDNVINSNEASSTVNITGTVAGDAAIGDTVTLTVNGQNYTGSVVNSTVTGSTVLVYSIEVNGSDLAADSSIVASVTGSDEFGNSFTANAVGNYDVDTNVIVSIDDNGTTQEGDDAQFIISLSQAPGSDVTIRLTTSFETASADDIGAMGVSYVDSNGDTQSLTVSSDGSVTIPAGVTSLNVTVPTIVDGIQESNENFSVRVIGVDGVIGNDIATTTIIDNDNAPVVNNITSAVNADGDAVDEGEGAVFTISLSNASSSATTYDFSLTNGTAGSDDYDTDLLNVTFSGGVTYDADSGKITVPAGVTEFTATVATTDDNIYEANEVFTLTVGGQTGTATIIDNE